MHTRVKSGACGLTLGLALAWGSGIAPRTGPAPLPGTQEGAAHAGDGQPEATGQPLPGDPVERELALLHRGLFRDQSELPQDPEQSIEQMLAGQSAAIARLEARLTAMGPAHLDAIERRLASFEDALRGMEAAGGGALERSLQEIRRTVDDLDRRVADVPRSDLGELARTVQELERRLDRQTQRSSGTLESSLRQAQSSIRTLEDRVRSLERRIP